MSSDGSETPPVTSHSVPPPPAPKKTAARISQTDRLVKRLEETRAELEEARSRNRQYFADNVKLSTRNDELRSELDDARETIRDQSLLASELQLAEDRLGVATATIRKQRVAKLKLKKALLRNAKAIKALME